MTTENTTQEQEISREEFVLAASKKFKLDARAFVEIMEGFIQRFNDGEFEQTPEVKDAQSKVDELKDQIKEIESNDAIPDNIKAFALGDAQRQLSEAIANLQSYADCDPLQNALLGQVFYHLYNLDALYQKKIVKTSSGKKSEWDTQEVCAFAIETDRKLKDKVTHLHVPPTTGYFAGHDSKAVKQANILVPEGMAAAFTENGTHVGNVSAPSKSRAMASAICLVGGHEESKVAGIVETGLGWTDNNKAKHMMANLPKFSAGMITNGRNKEQTSASRLEAAEVKK